ncbi:MAG TPA: flagellar hook-associated protein FlgK [Gammaproteobacteria bacterium]|nr:flagellar hook-associated protein FlgK [Gammaproteobacteria bacterium]
MATSGMLGIGLSGLLATRQALSTTSQNISNVNTEGYSRQRVEFESRPPEVRGGSFLGTGVDVRSIDRVYDEFVVEQSRVNTSTFNSLNEYHDLITRVDDLLASPDTGLDKGVVTFFDAVHEVANDPASLSARQVMLSEAQSLTDRFHYLDERVAELRSQSNAIVQNSIEDINGLAGSIADLNRRISLAVGTAGGAPNDLLDQRDRALDQLAELVSVTTVAQNDGSTNVFIGTGQALVVGPQAQSLSAVRNRFDPTRFEVGYSTGSATAEISSQVTGGSLGGLLNFRDQVLDPVQNALGRVALSMADTLNTQHQLGMDFNGDLGGKMFTTATPDVLSNSTNAGSGAVSAVIVNVADVEISDYQLTYNGSNAYTLTRLSDNTSFAINTGGASPYTSDEIDGMRLTLTAGASTGDTFLVRPGFSAARDIAVALTDVSKIAAAAPVRVNTPLANTGSAVAGGLSVNSPDNRLRIEFTSPTAYKVVDETTGATLAANQTYTSGANIRYNGLTVQVSDGSGAPAAGDKFYVDRGVTSADSANTGGAGIGAASVSPPDPNLLDTVTITFTSATTFDVSGATTGSPVTGLSYTAGAPISYNGWTFSLTGVPASGDSFVIEANTGGIGDNRNALKLADLQDTRLLDQESATYQEAYGQLIADVGSQTRSAALSRDAGRALMDQARAARDAVSGVNLDEEAANLLQFQQAYQAAAQVVSVSADMFQIILDAVRR